MAATCVRSQSDADEASGAVDSGSEQDCEVSDLLLAIAISFRESIRRFDETVGRITEIVTRHSVHNDREFVMALQNFDRLQQEFATLGEVVERISAAGDRSGADAMARFCRDVIASVSMSELQERLAYHFRIAVEEPLLLEESEDVEF